MTEGSLTRGHEVGSLARLTHRWVNALASTCYVPLSRAERHALLYRFAERLVAAVVAEPFSEQPGYDVGTELVAADFATPEALGVTIEVLDGHLFRTAGEPADGRARVAKVLGSLATGHSWAMRDRTLDEQEAIRAAALVTREEAQRALRESEARFRHAALHDPLTGMPNRAYFADRLDQVFHSAKPGDRVGLCFIDLDFFKSVNDNLGHHTGDRLLAAVAERLTRFATEIGQFAARLAGDEFLLLLQGTTGADEAVKVADLFMAALAEPVRIEGRELSLTASVGIVERPVAEADAAELMRAADMTLHWAKSDGRARVAIYDPQRNAREMARYALAADMPGALERGEFQLVYQPIVRLDDGQLVGLEALARWHHPTLGELKPGLFIGLAEESGLIVPLGLRLLEVACREAATWRSISDDAPFVSVNLAARQIRHPRLVADVAAVLHRTGLPPQSLQLEIAESAVMRDDQETDARLRDLSDLGVNLAVDDFGTGYSKLAYLRALPVHVLKLAAEFVDPLRGQAARGTSAGAEAYRQEAALLRALVALGHTLKLSITAEGVQTAEQVEILRAIGCETGQGPFLGLPAGSDLVRERLRPTAAPA